MRKKSRRPGKYYVYIIQCKMGTYYAGCTNDLERRVKLHNAGRGAKYLRGKGPVKVVYVKEYKRRGDALSAEICIKKLRREQKEELVAHYRKAGSTSK